MWKSEVGDRDGEEAGAGGDQEVALEAPGGEPGDDREADVEAADVGDQVLVVRRQALDPVGEEGEVVVEDVRDRQRGEADEEAVAAEHQQRRAGVPRRRIVPGAALIGSTPARRAQLVRVADDVDGGDAPVVDRQRDDAGRAPGSVGRSRPAAVDAGEAAARPLLRGARSSAAQADAARGRSARRRPAACPPRRPCRRRRRASSRSGSSSAEQRLVVALLPGEREGGDDPQLVLRRRPGSAACPPRRGSEPARRVGGPRAGERPTTVGDLVEGQVEDVVEEEGGALGGGEALEHDQQRRRDRLVEGRVVLASYSSTTRLRQPLADVALAAGGGRCRARRGRAGRPPWSARRAGPRSRRASARPSRSHASWTTSSASARLPSIP